MVLASSLCLFVIMLLSQLKAGASMIDVSIIDTEDLLLETHMVMEVDASCDTLHSVPYPPSKPATGSRGKSLIHSRFLKKLQKVAGMEAPNPSLVSLDNNWHEVYNTYLHGTSDYHQDHKVVPGSQERELVEDLVGFVALNTNKEAYFEHSEMSVPIREGSFIRFQGSDPHRTVVPKGGHVHLLGPFELKSFAKVGAPPATTPTTTLTVEISIDGDGRINFRQVGFITLPSIENPPSAPFPNDVFVTSRNGNSGDVGAIVAGNSDIYSLVTQTNAQVSFDCLIDIVPTTLALNQEFRSGLLSNTNALTLFVPSGYNSNDDLTGSSATANDGLTLAGAGFNEGGICFVEYDTDGDSTTGDANGNDVRIEWQVGLSPSSSPSAQPSFSPSAQPSFSPSDQPSFSPSAHPSFRPSVQPSFSPSVTPSAKPSAQPSFSPSAQPSFSPSEQPSFSPSAHPSFSPSVQPSFSPSVTPSAKPSVQPSFSPSAQPSFSPSVQPSFSPSAQPSFSPSDQPSFSPSAQPSSSPSAQPSFTPSAHPSFSPSAQPSFSPSAQPSFSPSAQPSFSPSAQPSFSPSAQPSFSPSSQPSVTPSVTPSADPTMSNVPTISDCLSRSTKSPGKGKGKGGKGMKMRKTTKTAAPTGCLETKSPGKGMMMEGKGMRGKGMRGK